MMARTRATYAFDIEVATLELSSTQCGALREAVHHALQMIDEDHEPTTPSSRILHDVLAAIRSGRHLPARLAAANAGDGPRWGDGSRNYGPGAMAYPPYYPREEAFLEIGLNRDQLEQTLKTVERIWRNTFEGHRRPAREQSPTAFILADCAAAIRTAIAGITPPSPDQGPRIA